jgi:hypothetical protein
MTSSIQTFYVRSCSSSSSVRLLREIGENPLRTLTNPELTRDNACFIGRFQSDETRDVVVGTSGSRRYSMP